MQAQKRIIRIVAEKRPNKIRWMIQRQKKHPYRTRADFFALFPPRSNYSSSLSGLFQFFEKKRPTDEYSACRMCHLLHNGMLLSLVRGVEIVYIVPCATVLKFEIPEMNWWESFRSPSVSSVRVKWPCNWASPRTSKHFRFRWTSIQKRAVACNVISSCLAFQGISYFPRIVYSLISNPIHSHLNGYKYVARQKV